MAENTQIQQSQSSEIEKVSIPKLLEYYEKADTNLVKALNDPVRISLARVNKNFNREVVEALLIVWFTDLVEWFNVGKNMNAAQIKQLANFAYNGYYWMTIQEFKVFFHLAKSNHYGKLYDRLDGAIILDWLNQFERERDLEMEKIREERDRIFNIEDKPEEYSNGYLELLKSIVRPKI